MCPWRTLNVSLEDSAAAPICAEPFELWGIFGVSRWP